jgi:formamidopyrimidine-DNA glycosylase
VPELPEVEAARARVEAGALNRTVEAVSTGEIRHVKLPPRKALEQFVGTRFTEARRHGKYLFIGSKSGPWLHIHLGMSGSLRLTEEGEDTPKYARLTFAFEGGRQLHFRDPRKFGRIEVIEDVDAFIEAKGLGPDAQKIGDNAFAARVGGSKSAVKTVLLNQRKLAGVGNLWADEALYQSGIDPAVRADELTGARMRKLHKTLHDVLRSVVATDATYSKLPGDWLIHHRKAGDDCTRCRGTIAKKKVGGRTSYHCPDHQHGT